jgi:hypothetical protein
MRQAAFRVRKLNENQSDDLVVRTDGRSLALLNNEDDS